jgi:sodium-dependent dicarboxylate transporter 2/3/5
MGKSKAIKLPELGLWRAEERRVFIMFVLTALGWMFREEPFGGWSGWFGVKGAGDSTVALLSVMAMFLWPNGHGGRLLDWKTASKIPWGLLLMVGGSITIATAFDTSGLSAAIGDALAGSSKWPVFAMVAAIAFGAGFITNMMNHTAMAALMMPLLAAAAKSAGINPILLMMPAAMSISMAFMMPISTMTNMIIYGTGYISVRTMVREGFVPNLIGAATVAVMCWLLLPR